MQASKYKQLLDRLKQMNPGQLVQAMPTVLPDSLLQQLLQDRIAVDSKLTSLLATQGENNPEVKTTQALMKKNSDQIDERISGILNALQTQLDLARAQADDAVRKIAETRDREADNSRRTAPYYQAKAELEQLKKFRDVLSTRIVLEKLDRVMPQATLPRESNQSISAILRIAVDDNNQIYLNDQAVSDDELKSELTRMKALNPDLSAVITGSDRAKFQKIRDVLDILQGLGITKVGLKTGDSGSSQVKPSANATFSVGGEVKSPSNFKYSGHLTLQEAINLAGGFTDFANRKNVQVTRADGKTVITLNLETGESQNFNLNLEISVGDSIFVAKKLF